MSLTSSTCSPASLPPTERGSASPRLQGSGRGRAQPENGRRLASCRLRWSGLRCREPTLPTVRSSTGEEVSPTSLRLHALSGSPSSAKPRRARLVTARQSARPPPTSTPPFPAPSRPLPSRSPPTTRVWSGRRPSSNPAARRISSPPCSLSAAPSLPSPGQSAPARHGAASDQPTTTPAVSWMRAGALRVTSRATRWGQGWWQASRRGVWSRRAFSRASDTTLSREAKGRQQIRPSRQCSQAPQQTRCRPA
mmetsp:Transcript_15154/g.31243  ORF Transcript_15154/g.31243 Transcript_15154/m.31243 type:complete len:251 (+) Transcript_15154:893-1645(+)